MVFRKMGLSLNNQTPINSTPISSFNICETNSKCVRVYQTIAYLGQGDELLVSWSAQVKADGQQLF